MTSLNAPGRAVALPIRRHGLFDFGGPMLLTPFELNDRAERSMGVAPGSLLRGPFDRDNDAGYRAWQAEEISEREYWAARAAEVGLDTIGYMRHFFEPSGDHLIRPEMAAIVSEIQAAGKRAGLLTNDLSKFHGPEWREPISVLRLFDPFVDLSLTGTLKPDPRAYTRAITEMGVPAEEIVFIDDQIYNVRAACDAGIHGVLFDPTDVSGSIMRFRSALAGE